MAFVVKPYSAKVMSVSKKLVQDGLVVPFARSMASTAKRSPGNGGAPRLTGNLAKSIDVEKVGQKFARVFTSTGYGGFVELGTARMRANPYLSRAFRRVVTKFKGFRHIGESKGIK